jgi:putative SOS response-associated peptidase YedK
MIEMREIKLRKVEKWASKPDALVGDPKAAPGSGEWVRTFAVITTDANELVADIHARMPVVLALGDYARWLGDEPDPRDLMQPFLSELMRMWPISTRVNKPENDDPSDCRADPNSRRQTQHS